MWGTRGHACIGCGTYRFIPTHVGNTGTSPPRPRRSSVHPHACGEHYWTRHGRLDRPGSSPRMWGTRGVSDGTIDAIRFIPTHVGNTPCRNGRTRTAWVHPHACGEHVPSSFARLRHSGSSPRMWGTRAVVNYYLGSSRFIPTHVGNTPPLPSPASGTPVHPHACGEHNSGGMLLDALRGSSPRMWGTPVLTGPVCQYRRFIPTHVGNTRRCQLLPGVKSVHPHACGEHNNLIVGFHRYSGSSPRMWGTPLCSRWPLPCRRFIPTHVGNTRGSGLLLR